MERLWAPWRMEYVGKEQKPGCLFCRVIENPDDPDASLVVWRPHGAVVMLNKFPYNSGHVMVVPVAHKPDLAELSDEESASLMSALRRTLKVLRAELTPEGFNVGANIGRVSGAGIPDHVHLHVVPRWNGDTNFMPVLAEVKVINEHVERTAEKLKAAFSS
jgi:ATP adenylyltransferase